MAGWYRDPSRRFEHRYWNGTAWTTHVMADGVRTIDTDDRAPSAAEAEPAEMSGPTDIQVEDPVVEEPVMDEPVDQAPELEALLVKAPAVVPVAEEPTAAPQPAARPRWPLAVWVLVLLGVALLVFGATLPWAEAQNATSSFTQDGIETDGAIIIVVAAVIALALIVVSRPKLAAALVIAGAVVAGAIGARYAVDTSSKASDLVDRGGPGISAGLGVGVWVTLAAAAIVLIGGIAAFVVASRAPTT